MRTLEQSPADGCCGSQPLEEQFLESVPCCAAQSRLCPWQRLRLETGEEGPGTPPLPGLPQGLAPLQGMPGCRGRAGQAGAGSPEGKYLLLLLFPRASVPWERCLSAVPSCSVCSHVFLLPFSFVSSAALSRLLEVSALLQSLAPPPLLRLLLLRFPHICYPFLCSPAV